MGFGTVAQRRVKPFDIIVQLEVSDYIVAGVFPGSIHGPVDSLRFERGVERFREHIIEHQPTRPTDCRTPSWAAVLVKA